MKAQSQNSPPIGWGLYIHWPYCLSLCPYCDFNRTTRRDLTDAAWRNAVIADLRYSAAFEQPQSEGMRLESVFFGGGTPSLAQPTHIADILAEIKRLWVCDEDSEITLEANPTTAEHAKFKDFALAGVNRLSLGVQSLRDSSLHHLGRNYTATEAHRAIETAITHFKRVNLDFIYARTHAERPEEWIAELQEALDYKVGHLSLYQLTLEKHTPFFRLAKAGSLKIPNENKATRLYRATIEKMRKAHYKAYEISNFSHAGEESRHNLVYWQYRPYIGIGPGAHGRVSLGSDNKYASERAKSPATWAKQAYLDTKQRPSPKKIPPQLRFTEKLMMGLRLYDGIALKSLQAEDPASYAKLLHSENLQILCKSGYIEINSHIIKATDTGILCLDAIIRGLLNDI